MSDMSDGPELKHEDFHPDHPGPLGWLIHNLHMRLLALEGKAASTVKAVETKVEHAAEVAREDVVAAVHKVEDALGISHD